MEKIAEIKEWLEKRNFTYVEIFEDSVDKIYNLLIGNIFVEPTNNIEYLYYGVYFIRQKDEEKAIKYYNIAVKNGSIPAMINLGLYYRKKGDDDNIVRYLSMASDLGDAYAIIIVYTIMKI
jgi:hypothetical protein